MTRYMLQMLFWTIFMGVLIFWPAGTLAYPAGWACSIAVCARWRCDGAVAVEAQPEPVARAHGVAVATRAEAMGPRLADAVHFSAFCAWLRLSWVGMRRVPASPRCRSGLQALGALFIIANGAGTYWTFRENAFAAPVVKIQQGRRRSTPALTHSLRHPMYTSAALLLIGMPLLLGSWIGLVLSVVFILRCRVARGARRERTLAG